MPIYRDSKGWYKPVPAKETSALSGQRVRNALEPYIRGRHCFLDVGAFLGAWSAAYSKVFSRVVAIEPIPEHMDCIKENAPGIKMIQAAAWNQELPELDAWQLYGMRAHHSATQITINRSAYIHHKVRAITIDSLQLAVTLIKIDTNGTEIHVIQGAEETIQRHNPVLVLPTRCTTGYVGEIVAFSTPGYCYEPIGNKVYSVGYHKG